GPPQGLDVPILDVAAVLPQMHGDSVGAGGLADRGRLDGIWVRRPTRLPKRGHVVDVDLQLHHFRDLYHGTRPRHVGSATIRPGWRQRKRAGRTATARRRSSWSERATRWS